MLKQEKVGERQKEKESERERETLLSDFFYPTGDVLSLEEESLTVIGVGSRPRPKTSSEVSARDRFKFIPYHERFYLIFFFVNLPIGFNSFGDRVERSENIGKRR